MNKKISIKCEGNELIEVSEFTDLQGNLKTLTTDAYNRMKISIEKYDFRFPIFYVLLSNKKYILDGHGRLKTIRKMISEGYEFGSNNKLPAVKIDAKDKIEAKEILLALNSKFGEMSEEGFYEFAHEDEYELDLEEMNKIFNPGDFDMDHYMKGYEIEQELPDIEIEDLTEVDTKIDEKEPIVIKANDIIVLGEHRVMCGDSENEADLLLLLDTEIPEVVVTDPPYGIKYQSSHRKASSKSETFEEISNDDVILEKWMPLAKKYSRGWIMYWVGWQNLADWIDVSSKHFGHYTNIMVWRKTWGMGDITGSFKNGEMGLIYNMGAKLQEGKRPSCIFDGTMNLAGLQHSNQKPVSLFIDMLDGLPDGSVLDFFGGSGSNLLACDQVGRKCFMMELTPSNVQLIINRYTGTVEDHQIEINGVKVDWLEYKKKGVIDG